MIEKLFQLIQKRGSYQLPLKKNMPLINSTVVPSSSSRTLGSSDISNLEDRDAWFDAIDHVEMDETWFDACDSHHADPVFAGETADSRVPFTEDCRRSVQQFIRTLGEYEESRMFSVCLSKMLPGTPGSLVMAASSLYSAITEHRNIDAAALHALGLASWCLPDNINIVSQLATFIRDTVTGWTDETFLQQFLGSEENHTSTYLFTALAITAIVAGRWMKDEGSPQRGPLKVPAFIANIFIRASHYWIALGNMASSLPSSRETWEKPESFRRTPAFEVDTSVEMTGEVCDAAVSCFPSEPRITAFLSNSTAFSGAYTRATVQNKLASAPGNSPSLSVIEQAHSLVVDKLRQENGLSALPYCTTLKTETRQQTNEKAITNTYFNTKCDATAYSESLRKFAENTDILETQVSPVATSLSGKVPDSPLVATSGNSAFVSGRNLSSSASGNTVHTITSGNIFSTMLSQLVNTLYRTRQFISQHDPLRFPEANALPIKEKQNDSMRKDTRKIRHGQRKLRRNPTRKANHRVKKLLRSRFFPNTKKVSKERLLYAVSTYLFYGNNGIAGNENKVTILARTIRSARGLYGGTGNEPLSTVQAEFTVRHWVFENILGMLPDKYIESKMKRDAYPNYFTIGSVQHLLPVDTLPADSRIHSDSMNPFEITMLLTMWKSFLMEEMPFLSCSEKSVKKMQLSSYDFANLYSGSRFLKTVLDKNFTAEEAMATGEIMWDSAVHEGVTEDKLAYHLAPALFFAASVSSRNTRQDMVNKFDAINRYLQYRKETSDVKKDIEQKYDNYLSATKKWLSKGALADDIISQCPVLLPGLTDLADAIRTPEQKREKAEKFSKENYLNGFFKPCDNAPESLDDEYKKSTSDVADSFREIDKYLILSAIGGLPEEEQIFISSPDATIHSAEMTMRTNRPAFSYLGGVAYSNDITVSLDRTDLVAVFQGKQERIYALKGVQSEQEGYKLIRVDRDIRKYINNAILDYDFRNKYEVDGSVVKHDGDRFGYSIFAKGNENSDNSNNIDYLVNLLSNKHHDTLYHTLYKSGNDQSNLQKTWSVIKHIIPFYDCVEGIINNDPEQAIPSCLMDAVAFIPVFGKATSLGAKFGMGLARGLRSGAVIVGKEGIKSAGKSLLREISLPTTAELASLGKGTLKAIDPGFQMMAGISRKFGNKMVFQMSGNKKTAELAQEIASSRVLDRLPQVPTDAKVMGILPETQLQVPVKVIGKKRGRDIYVRVNPETGVVGGTKYFCSKNGNLKLFSFVPGKHSLPRNTSNRVKRGGDNPNLCSGSGAKIIHEKRLSGRGASTSGMLMAKDSFTELNVFQPLGLTKSSGGHNFLSYARGIEEADGKVLEVFGHGSRGTFNLAGEDINAEKLHNKLREIVTDYDKYPKVKLIVCHSADYVDGYNFAKSFSEVSKKITVGYKGVVFKKNTSPTLGRVLDGDSVADLKEGFDLAFVKMRTQENIRFVDTSLTIEGTDVIFNPTRLSKLPEILDDNNLKKLSQNYLFPLDDVFTSENFIKDIKISKKIPQWAEAYELLDFNSYFSRFTKNKALDNGLFQFSNGGGYVYRLDEYPPEYILKNGFKESSSYYSVDKMIPEEEKGLIVSEDIMGVMRYKNFVKKDETMFLYKIDISNVRGVSLKDNLMINHPGLQKFLKHTPQAKYETLDSIGGVSNGAVYLSETHIYLKDISLKAITPVDMKDIDVVTDNGPWNSLL